MAFDEARKGHANWDDREIREGTALKTAARIVSSIVVTTLIVCLNADSAGAAQYAPATRASAGVSGVDKVVRSNGQVRTYLTPQGALKLATLNLGADALADELRKSGIPFLVGVGMAPSAIRWTGLSNLDNGAVLSAYFKSCKRGVMVVQGFLYGPITIAGKSIGIGYLIVAPRDDGRRC